MVVLEKLFDVRNSLQGKLVAMFVAIVLVCTLTNFSAFAEATNDAAADSQQTELIGTGVPANETRASADQAGEGEQVDALDDSPAAVNPVEPVPNEEIPRVKPDVAAVKLDLSNAYLMFLDQIIAMPAQTFDVPAHKELHLQAIADEGFEIASVKAVIDGNETVVQKDGSGRYIFASELVTSALTIVVETESIDTSEESSDEGGEAELKSAAEPFTSGTVIGEDEAATKAVSEAAETHVVTWYVNGKISKQTTVSDGDKPSFGGTPTRGLSSKYINFAGWASSPNSKAYRSESELPVVKKDVTYYASFTAKSYFYFVLEGKSNTSRNSRDYMYAGSGTMLVPDDFKNDSRWYDGTNFNIYDYIISTPGDAAIRKGIAAVYKNYQPEWEYSVDWTTLTIAKGSVGYNYQNMDPGNAMHTDGAIQINKETTVGVTYSVRQPDGNVVTNSTTHDKHVDFPLNSTVDLDKNSFTTDGYTYDSYQTQAGSSYKFDGWYTDQSYTTKAPESVALSSPATYYARYVANVKKLFYDANEGMFADGTSGLKEATQQVGSRVNFITEPTKEGCDFIGWRDQHDGTLYPSGTSGMTMPDRDVMLVAEWEVIKATISVWFYPAEGGYPFFLNENGEVGNSGTNRHSKEIGLADREGYSDAEIAAFSEEAYGLRGLNEEYWYYELMVNHKGDFINQWEPIDDIASYEIKNGDDIRYFVSSRSPVSVSYRFVSDGAGDVLPDGVMAQLGNAAVASAYKHSTVTNEFAGTEYKDVEVADPVTGAIRGAYTFSGWDKEQVLDVADDVVFTGTWTFEPADYSVSGIIDNGGTVTNDNQKVAYGDRSLEMAFQAADAYRIVSITVNGVSQDVRPGQTLYVFDAVSAIDKDYIVEVKTVALGAIAVIAPSDAKVYDGAPLAIDEPAVDGLPDGHTLTAEVRGFQIDVGRSGTTISNIVIRDENRAIATENFTIEVIEGSLRVDPATVVATADRLAKNVGTDDPVLTYAIAGGVNGEVPGFTGALEREQGEAVGAYPINQGTLALSDNGAFAASNYRLRFVAGVLNVAGATPLAVQPPDTPAPASTPTPRALPADDPIAPVANVLQGIVKTVIPDEEPSLAGPSSTIEDDETPLGSFDYVHCWVHYYLYFGIFLTMLYGAGVLVRRIRFAGKLKKYESDVLEIEDETARYPVGSAAALAGKA